MYNSLRGKYQGLLVQGAQTFVLLDQGGLEWMIEASRFTLMSLPVPDSELRLWLWLHHTEDTMALFGFASQEERRVFLELLKVQGIGPRAAIKILSGTTPSRLVSLLENEDLDGLEKIPGLGKKTSQKVLLTLKGKLVLSSETSPSDKITATGPDEDMVQALVAMGFDRKDASREVARIAPELAGLSLDKRDQELLRRAIIALSQA